MDGAAVGDLNPLTSSNLMGRAERGSENRMRGLATVHTKRPKHCNQCLGAPSQETAVSFGESSVGTGGGGWWWVGELGSSRMKGWKRHIRMTDWNYTMKGWPGICFSWVKMCHLLSDFSIWSSFNTPSPHLPSPKESAKHRRKKTCFFP